MYPGSTADMPGDLLDQIKELERQFTVDQATLKKVTDHFVKELEKGACGMRICGEDRR